ncbi:MAG TPA: hypothetical protein VLN90_07485, partial [Thioalkalivibrio sp.]|nr:hypothetical protein [Thioalkalivibrio sp.]
MSAVLDMGQPLTEAELDTLMGHVAQGVTPVRGSVFFEQLVEGLARALGADFVSVGQVTGVTGDQVRTLALYADGAIRPDMAYPLADSPCAQILTAGLCVYARDVQRLFPRDRSLAKNRITGYAGAALYDANGSAIGTLAVMSRHAI